MLFLNYIQQVISFLDKIPKSNTSTTIRADLNVSIGNRLSKLNSTLDPEEVQIEKNLLGPNGNPYQNKKGEEIINMLKQTQHRK